MSDAAVDSPAASASTRLPAAAAAAVAHAEAQFDSGDFFRLLAGRVACRTESQNPARAPELLAYLVEQIAPALQALGFAARCTTTRQPVRRRC